MLYLLKITLAWSLFLLLFEALYKSSGKFTFNRIYLLLSIAAGLLLPLVQLPGNTPAVITASQNIYPAAMLPVAHVAAIIDTKSNSAIELQHPGIGLILGIFYGMGALVVALKYLLANDGIFRLINRGERRIINGRKVIVTGLVHAPYSYMGWIFLTDPAAYTAGELSKIILHEAAHNDKKHGLDLLLLQVLCIVFWWHPLVWRYRYLLQLQHEYEADDIAAGNDAYGYGHFLIRQILLNGVPSPAHSFHFSPIKNRISMLTKKQHRKSGAWKYLFLVPATLGCTFLMAKTAGNEYRVRQGNVTTYIGNAFKWRQSVLTSVATIKEGGKSYTGSKSESIYEMNGEPVYQNEYLKEPASFGSNEMAYSDYLRKEFEKQRKNLPDSLTAVILSNLVIDKEGRAVYYDLRAVRPVHKYLQNIYHPYGDQEPVLNAIMDKIIRQGPRWKPAMFDGRAVNSVIKLGGGC